MSSADSMPRISDGGWHSPAVAAGQYAVVEAELEQPPERVPPYAAFLRAIDLIDARMPHGASLLDVGCGVGHYCTLLRRHRPGAVIRYYGTDSSLAMIAVARMREPDGYFEHLPIDANRYNAYDIVLMGLVAEVTENPVGFIAQAIMETRGWLIWHRVRLAAHSGFIDEPTYAGHRGKIWLWAEADVRAILGDANRPVQVMPWPERDDHLTIVMGPRHG